MPRPRSSRPHLTAALAVGLVAFATATTVVVVKTISAMDERRQVVESRTELVASGVRQSVDVVISDLEAFSGLFQASDIVTAEKFATFARSLDMGASPSDVIVVAPTRPHEVDEVARQLDDAYGLEPFSIVDGASVPLIPQPMHYIATHEYRSTDDGSVLGLDFATLPSRLRLIDTVHGSRATRLGQLGGNSSTEAGGLVTMVPILGANRLSVSTIVVGETDVGGLLEASIPQDSIGTISFDWRDITDQPPPIDGPYQTSVVFSRGGRSIQIIATDLDPPTWGSAFPAMVSLAIASLIAALATGAILNGRRRAIELTKAEERNRTILDHQAALERYEAIATNATDIVTRSDASGKFLYVSPSVEVVLGYRPDELTGTLLLNVIHPADRRAVQVAVRSLFWEDGETIDIDYRARHIDGHYLWFGSLARLVVTTGGVEIQASSRDVSERVAQQEELRAARLAAEEASEAKAQFIANISHEIRTPLNAIIGMTDLALGSDLSGTQREHLQLARSSAKAAVTIVNDVLDLSKAASGRMSLSEEGFATFDLCSDVVRMLQPDAQKRSLELVLSYDRRLPDRLWGDAGRIRQILINLVGNALKFTHVGGVTLSVSPGHSGGIRCEVTDTGIGIPPDRIESIFEDFTQADSSTTRVYGGTGLGLGISRRLVELMGGRMWVTSEPGQGSTFAFELPLGAWSPESDGPDRVSNGVPVVAPNHDDVDAMRALLAVGNRHAYPIDVDKLATEGRVAIVVVQGREDLLGAQATEVARVLIVDSVPARGNSEFFRLLGAGGYIGRPAEALEILDLLDSIESDPIRFVTRHDIREQRLKRRVLVADDVTSNRLVVEQLLSRRGHEVTVVGDGLEALQMVQVHEFDIVLMDVEMPTMDGLTATRKIREYEAALGRHTLIFALTGRSTQESLDEATAAGCDGYITKPFDAHRLCASVEQLISDNADVQPIQSISTLDLGILADQTDGDPALLAIVLNTARTELAEQRRNLATTDSESIKSTAHLLKGMLGMIGAMPAAAVAAALESVAAAGDDSAIASRVAELDESLSQLSAAIDEVLGREEPSMTKAT